MIDQEYGPLDLALRPGETTAVIGTETMPVFAELFAHAMRTTPPVAICAEGDAPLLLDAHEVGRIDFSAMSPSEVESALLVRLPHYEAAFFPSVVGVAVPSLPRIAKTTSTGLCYLIDVPGPTLASAPDRGYLDYLLPRDLHRFLWVDPGGNLVEQRCREKA